MIADVDLAVGAAATAFADAVFANGWRGREREAVSLYAIGYLIPQCRPGTALHSPTQIAVEAAVPGVPGLNPKGRVNKDLVIWARPAQTCWDDAWVVVHDPVAVLEWKVYRRTTRAPVFPAYDLEWLQRFSTTRPHFVGYSIWLDLARRNGRLAAARVYAGGVEMEWLQL